MKLPNYELYAPLLKNTHANTSMVIANTAPKMVQHQSVDFLSDYFTGSFYGNFPGCLFLFLLYPESIPLDINSMIQLLSFIIKISSPTYFELLIKLLEFQKQ